MNDRKSDKTEIWRRSSDKCTKNGETHANLNVEAVPLMYIAQLTARISIHAGTLQGNCYQYWYQHTAFQSISISIRLNSKMLMRHVFKVGQFLTVASHWTF